MSILLIDIGNSRLKWAMASSNGDLDSDFIDLTDWSSSLFSSLL
jgi:pantothenate kinase type III